jgi:hypothetical protein
MAKITEESVYEEIRKAGRKGKGLSAKSKIPHLEQLLRKGEIKKLGSKYYVADIPPRPEEIYEKVERAAWNGTTLLPLEVHVVQDLVRDQKIKKVGKKYYVADIISRPEEIYEKVERAAWNGTTLLPLEVHVVQDLVRDQKIKKVGKKYYLRRYEPLTQKKVIERLLNSGTLRKIGTKYVIVREHGEKAPIEKPIPSKIPSFSEFVEALQDIYLRKAREYRHSISIISLLEVLTSEMDISRDLAEKWILELPQIFIGIVDLRPFPGEPGLKKEDGTEVSRIYFERGIVGL